MQAMVLKRLGDHVAQQRQAACDKDRQGNVDQRFNLSPDSDPLHQALQQPGKQSRFQEHYEECGDIEMVSLVEVSDNGRDRS